MRTWRSKNRPQRGGVIAACGRRKTRPLEWSTEHADGVLWNTGGMYRVEFYAAVRRSVYVEGLSERAAARRFGFRPGRRCARCCATACRSRVSSGETDLGVRNWTPSPGSSIKSSPTISSARRNNGTRPSASGSAYASSTPSRAATRLSKTTCAGRSWAGEMFVPLAHPPGDAQARLRRSPGGHRTASNARRTTWSWVCRTATTRSCRRFRLETTEAFCEGHNAAFRYFGGVPRGIVYDNTTLAVAKILGDGTPAANAELQRAPLALLVRRSLRTAGEGQRQRQGGRAGRLRPPQLLRASRRASASWDALNADLARQCRARQRAAVTAAHRDDRGALRARPAPRCCRCRRSRMKPATRARRRVTSLSLVRYRRNDYSVPTAYGPSATWW